MKKIFKALGCLLAVVLAVFASGMTSEAASAGKLSKTDLSRNFEHVKVIDGQKDYSETVKYKIGDKIAFCIEPYVLTEAGDMYSASNDSYVKKIKSNKPLVSKMEYAVYFGFTKQGQTDKAYAFTQMKLWELIMASQSPYKTVYGSTISKVYFDNASTAAEYSAWSKEIDAKINFALNKSVSFNNQTITLHANDEATLVDTNGVLADFRITNQIKGITMNPVGNRLTIKTVNATPNTQVKFRFKAKLFEGAKENPDTVFFAASGDVIRQHLAEFNGIDPHWSEININIIEDLKGTLWLEKHDINTTGKSLAGAVYEIVWEKTGKPVGTITTDEKGQGHLSNLPAGTYQIIEKISPEGFTVNKMIKRVLLRRVGEKLVASSYDWETQAIYTEYAAQLEAYNKDAEAVGRQAMANDAARVADHDGWITVHDKAKLGYIELLKEKETLLDGNNATEGKAFEGGIVFELKNEQGDVVDTMTTNKEGIAISKLVPTGTYTLTQKTTHEGLMKIEDQQIIIKEDLDKLSFKYVNEAIKTTLKLQKTDGESGISIPLKDVEFSIFTAKEGGEAINFDGASIFKTDENGEVTFPKALPFGTYYIDEVKLPDAQGYYLDPDGERVEVEINGNYTNITKKEIVKAVPQIQQKGVLTINKIGEKLTNLKTEMVELAEETYEITTPVFENRPLAGAIFEIIADEDITTKDGVVHYKKGEVADTITTSEEGVAETKELPLGKYMISEKTAPNGYLLNEEKVPFEFTAQASHVRIDSQSQNMLNLHQDLKVSFNKTFEASKWFEHEKTAPGSVVFGLYLKQAITENGITLPEGTLVGVSGLDEAMKVNFDLVLEGQYEIKELKTGEAYVLSEASKLIDYKYGENLTEGESIHLETIENALKRMRLSIFKSDSETKKALKGVEFTLFARTKKGDIEIGKYLTDENGYVTVDGLEFGDYFFKETAPNFGYVLDESEKSFSLKHNGEVKKVKVENTTTTIRISKQDATTGKELPGAKLRVVDLETGKTVDEWISSEKPHDIKGLGVGKSYKLIEDFAPLGYKIANAIEFTVANTGDIQRIVMKDELEEAPRTGDQGAVMLYATSMLLSSAAAVVLKKRYE